MRDPPKKLLAFGPCLKGGTLGPTPELGHNLDEALGDLFVKARMGGIETTRTWICEIAQKLSSHPGFKASEGFFHKWRRRRAECGLKIVSRKGEFFGTGTETDSMEELIEQVENFWVTWVSHRVLYDHGLGLCCSKR